MILVADSGSSKADWRLIIDNQNIKCFKTQGLSPYFNDTVKISHEINNGFPPDVDKQLVTRVLFHGAGCSADDKKAIVRNAISSVFPLATIEIETDMFGAARALFGKDEGIAAILGTGSNACLWDGQRITMGSPSLGYILGDEGSGAHLGKTLVKLYLNNELPSHLKDLFESKYELNKNIILDNVYRKPEPNKYLAIFSVFLYEQRHIPFINYTITTCFLDFFNKHIKTFPSHSTMKVRFIGSVAYSFSETLQECALASEITIDKIIKHPIDDLVSQVIENYHTI